MQKIVPCVSQWSPEKQNQQGVVMYIQTVLDLAVGQMITFRFGYGVKATHVQENCASNFEFWSFPARSAALSHDAGQTLGTGCSQAAP